MPLALDYEAFGIFFRMVEEEVALDLGAVDALAEWILPCVNGLLEVSGLIEILYADKLIAFALQIAVNDFLELVARKISSCSLFHSW